MRSTLLLVVMLAACAPEMPTVAETSGGEAEGAAGSVGVQSEALNSACAQLHQYLRYWVDQNTPGTLVCGANYLSDYYQCTTSSPPINYTFTRQLESIGAGGQCAAIVYAYGTSQSNKVYQVSCTQNGAAASCSRRALN